MNRNLVCSMLAALAVLAPQGVRAWGVPSVPSLPKSEPAPDTDSFFKSALEADALVGKSVDALFSAVASKEKIREIDELQAAVTKTSDLKEKDALNKKIAEAKQDTLAGADWAKVNEELKAQHDDHKNKMASAAIYNLALGLLKDTETVVRAKALVSAISSNPMLATKLIGVKDVLSSTAGQLEKLPKLVSGSSQLMSTVGLKALPTKASDPAAEWDAPSASPQKQS